MYKKDKGRCQKKTEGGGGRALNLVKIVRPMQNCNQYGFTETVSYLMGAVQRHEVEKHCIDMKKTFFGCSLDGDSAFEVVDRNIQTRELYCAGEKGQYWQASQYSYQTH